MKWRDIGSDFVGEFIGTFLLVFFGCGSVTVSVLDSAFSGLFEVAAIWGIGVTLAIYATRHISCAHLNPAVSIAMVLAKRMQISKLAAYLAGQFLGAFVASRAVFVIFIKHSQFRGKSVHSPRCTGIYQNSNVVWGVLSQPRQRTVNSGIDGSSGYCRMSGNIPTGILDLLTH